MYRYNQEKNPKLSSGERRNAKCLCWSMRCFQWLQFLKPNSLRVRLRQKLFYIQRCSHWLKFEEFLMVLEIRMRSSNCIFWNNVFVWVGLVFPPTVVMCCASQVKLLCYIRGKRGSCICYYILHIP